jgi:hypothetical protein
LIPVTYLRSSSVGQYKFCETAYILEYLLGFRKPSGFKADKGTITHKALEIVALAKKARQDKRRTFDEDETGHTFSAKVTPDEAVDAAFAHYTDPSRTRHSWSARDLRDIRGWVNTVRTFNGGQFWPAARTVEAVEFRFDITLPYEWAAYDYGGRRGQLCLKGTIDLVCRDGPDQLEIIDWKTGRALDWATGKPKDFEALTKDYQLRTYFLAVDSHYPAHDILTSIYYISDSGPSTICLGPDDRPIIEQEIRREFEKIRDTVVPRQIRPDWRCLRLCPYAKGWNDSPYRGDRPPADKDVCSHIHDEIVSIGLDRVIKQYALPGADAYSGGGRSAKPEGGAATP